MSGRNSAAADRNRPPGGPDADAAVPDGPRAGRVAVEVESAPGATTISVRGELDLVTMPFLAEQLTLVSRDKPGRLVFDLAGTAFMDCGSARLMASAGEWLPEGRRPVIRRPSPGVRRVLELTGLDAYCEIEGLVVGSIRTWLFAGALSNTRKQADERLDK
jgi:anti-sigma B factor antagonist